MRQLTIQTFTYYLIYSGARKAFRKIMYRKKFYFSCSKEMYHFEEYRNVRKKILNKLRYFANYIVKSFSMQNSSKSLHLYKNSV